jgi:hypothetical protein
MTDECNAVEQESWRLGAEGASAPGDLATSRPRLTSAACLSKHPDALEEGVAEDAIGPSGAAEIAPTSVEPPRCRQPGGNRGVSHAFNHRDEGLFGEVLDQVWPTRIRVHHPWRDSNVVEPRANHQWIDLPAKESIPACLGLQRPQRRAPPRRRRSTRMRRLDSVARGSRSAPRRRNLPRARGCPWGISCRRAGGQPARRPDPGGAGARADGVRERSPAA